MTAASRNSPCPCGSGKRYKACCGAQGAVRGPQSDLHGVILAALGCQRRGDLQGAEALYRQALAVRPDEPDCLHMLGVICLETGRDREAYELVDRSLSLTGWHIDAMRHNMGLILVKLLAAAGTGALRARRRQYRDFCRERDTAREAGHENERGERNPLVSIVVPSYNHRRWIGKALESVYGQTYRELELVVIDDGSTDGSAEIIRESLAQCPFPSRFIARENRGAHATINEGIAQASGEYVNVLNSDDFFPHDRIERMVGHVAHRNADWGFGGLSFVDDAGAIIDPAANRRVFDLVLRLAQVASRETLGVALVNSNLAVTTGNLFVRKSLLDTLGGFRDFRYNHDWDFCLRATLESEPVLVPANVYAYRMHGSNTISESPGASYQEANRMFAEHFARAIGGPAPKNPFAPTVHAWGHRVLLWAASNGQAFLIAPDSLRQLADLAGSSAFRAEDPVAADELEPVVDPNRADRLLGHLVDALPQRPLISILLPTYDTPAHWLHQCIGSVLNQIYPHWELCIADDASPQPHVRQIVERYAELDSRIRVCVRNENGHISEATNSALAMASGDFVALLDHDDELSPDALYWVAREVIAHPDARIVYSDEDKIDEAGCRTSPYLKPDWNPDLLRGQNFVSHLGVYRTASVRAVGGFRKGFEGAQDWDLALRISEAATAAQIRHIPRVLYHWRTIQGSTSRAVVQKSYVGEAQRRALQEHHDRIGHSVSLQQAGDYWNSEYAGGAESPKISLIADARGAALAQWLQCLPRLLAQAGSALVEIRLVHDEGANVALPDARIVPIRCAPGSSAGSVYRDAARDCRGELIGLASHPSWPADAHWAGTLAGYAMRAESGAVAPKMVTTDGRIAFAGTLLGAGNGVAFPYLGERHDVPGQFGRARLPQNFQALGGGFLLLQRQKLDEAGGFEPECASATAVQIALCLRLREAGRWNVWVPNRIWLTATLPDYAVTADDLALQRRRWPGAFAGDPAYHPALSRERLFEIA